MEIKEIAAFSMGMLAVAAMAVAVSAKEPPQVVVQPLPCALYTPAEADEILAEQPEEAFETGEPDFYDDGIAVWATQPPFETYTVQMGAGK